MTNFYNVDIGGETYTFLKGALTEGRKYAGKMYILMSGDKFRVTHQVMKNGDVFEVVDKLDASVKQQVIRDGFFIYDTMGGMNMMEWCAPCVHIVAKKLRFPTDVRSQMIYSYTQAINDQENNPENDPENDPQNNGSNRGGKDTVVCLNSKIGKCHMFINSKFVSVMKDSYGSLSLARGVCLLTPFLVNCIQNAKNTKTPEFLCGETGRMVNMPCSVAELKSMCYKTKVKISWINDDGTKKVFDTFKAVDEVPMHFIFVGDNNAIVFASGLETTNWDCGGDPVTDHKLDRVDNFCRGMSCKLLRGGDIGEDVANNVESLSLKQLALLKSLKCEKSRTAMLAMIFFHSI